jgi:hypothetical protein
MPGASRTIEAQASFLPTTFLNIFESRLISRQECEPVPIASLARPLVLDYVGAELYRRRILLAASLPC